MVDDRNLDGWYPSRGWWVTILGMVGDHPGLVGDCPGDTLDPYNSLFLIRFNSLREGGREEGTKVLIELRDRS